MNDLIEFGESHKIESPVSKVFAYSGTYVRMRKIGNGVQVCVSDFAKAFPKKNLSTIVNSKEIQDYVGKLSEIKNFSSVDLLKVTKGGETSEQGTWAHQRVALRIAQKLSTEFSIWVDERIEELLTIGMTATQPTLEAMLDNPDLVIGLATKLKQQREENQRLVEENNQKQALITQQAEKIQNDAPKVEHHDMFMGAEHGEKDVSIRKFLSQAGIKGERDFWHWFEYEKKMIYRDAYKKPIPYANFRYLFSMPDKYNDKNNWSGTQLMVNPTGKVELTRMYYKDHPENFLETSKINQLELWQ